MTRGGDGGKGNGRARRDGGLPPEGAQDGHTEHQGHPGWIAGLVTAWPDSFPGQGCSMKPTGVQPDNCSFCFLIGKLDPIPHQISEGGSGEEKGWINKGNLASG